MVKIEYLVAFKKTTLYCLALIGVASLMLVLSETTANAQSNSSACRVLNSQLASLSSSSSSGGNSAQYRKYDSAARSQQLQITKTKKIARRGRCTGLGFLNSKSSQCKRIVSSLKKMEANLRSLKKTRAKHAPRQAGNSRTRNKILRKLKQNRCNKVSVIKTSKNTKPKRKTLIEQIFGTKTYSDSGQQKKSPSNDNQPVRISNFGTFRTLCVRKTDGYYFPISFSTVQDRFETDQETCQAMCPGVNVGLYHHRMPSEDSEEMISYKTGKEYATENFAFAYRKSIDLENRCRFATENRLQSIEITSSEFSAKPESTRIGIPVFRQDPALSPDDQDLQNDKLSFKQAQTYLNDALTPNVTPENQLLAENRKIRIVGPAFFPVQ